MLFREQSKKGGERAIDEQKKLASLPGNNYGDKLDLLSHQLSYQLCNLNTDIPKYKFFHAYANGKLDSDSISDVLSYYGKEPVWLSDMTKLIDLFSVPQILSKAAENVCCFIISVNNEIELQFTITKLEKIDKAKIPPHDYIGK
jgi:hypothetical protein